MALASRIAFCLALALWAGTALAGEYDFSIPEAEKKPYDLGGRAELRYVQHWLNDESDRFRLNFYDDDPGAYIDEWRPQLELRGSYSQGKVQFHALTHHEYDETYQGGDWANRVYEAYASLKPTASYTIEAGKKSYLWGVGYAWNPSGFINRPKDPDDPELNQEGYTVLGLDFIKSLSWGALDNMALTVLVLPVLDGWENTSLGQSGDIDYTAKLYLLWHDTDLDFIYFDGPTSPRVLASTLPKTLRRISRCTARLAINWTSSTRF